jgi:hypothetical protein
LSTFGPHSHGYDLTIKATPADPRQEEAMTNVDRRPAFLAAFDQAAAILSGVQPDQLGRSTPCRAFNVGSSSTTWWARLTGPLRSAGASSRAPRSFLTPS